LLGRVQVIDISRKVKAFSNRHNASSIAPSEYLETIDRQISNGSMEDIKDVQCQGGGSVGDKATEH
jgi:hypothetical protein